MGGGGCWVVGVVIILVYDGVGVGVVGVFEVVWRVIVFLVLVCGMVFKFV